MLHGEVNVTPQKEIVTPDVTPVTATDTLNPAAILTDTVIDDRYIALTDLIAQVDDLSQRFIMRP